MTEYCEGTSHGDWCGKPAEWKVLELEMRHGVYVPKYVCKDHLNELKSKFHNGTLYRYGKKITELKVVPICADNATTKI